MKRSPLLLRKTKLVSVNLNTRNHRTFLPVLSFKRKKPKQEKVSVEMIKCLNCGVNIPKSEAVGSEEGWFCSEEHRS